MRELAEIALALDASGPGSSSTSSSGREKRRKRRRRRTTRLAVFVRCLGVEKGVQVARMFLGGAVFCAMHRSTVVTVQTTVQAFGIHFPLLCVRVDSGSCGPCAVSRGCLRSTSCWIFLGAL